MDFKALQEANDSIELTDIKGKKYAQVNQRIKAFRMCYPEGAIVLNSKTTQMDGVCLGQQFMRNTQAKYWVQGQPMRAKMPVI